ncbi:hypothetical protein PVAND_013218 [Polypedilum vanderplanki]|uniref:Lipocalin/cytosolic fatty-acid binding domain-containing protein n=1 Tax=Polypedilum vanderplanki TaxID=319348 RepID=A0A9J6CQU8_POLVA|nr:hypothetical protein PVAND_013218 [Polypedilum vanderplanki]
MKFFIGILALLVCSVSALEFDRPCRDTVAAKENFSPAFYTGNWFELYNSLDQGNADCIDHHYTRRGLQQVFDVERIGFVEGLGFLREAGVASVAFPNETPMRAIFNATITRITGGTINYNYRVVATDYTNYAVVWSCTDLPNNRSQEEGAILGRQIQLNEASYTKVDAILESVELNREDFRFIDHSPERCGLETERNN